MRAAKLLGLLVIYYAGVAAIIAAVLWLVPAWRENLPIGRIQALISKAGAGASPGGAAPHFAHVESLAASLVWLVSAIGGALLVSLPVSWVYQEVRNPDDYDQSLAGVIVMLPLVITAIVVIIQDSLALSFSLAGIAGAVRFRNSLKSSGDLLFILLCIGIGLSAGIGAMELAITASIAFNLCFLALWAGEYGERHGMKRYMSDYDPTNGGTADVTVTQVAAAVVTETHVHSTPKPPEDGPARSVPKP